MNLIALSANTPVDTVTDITTEFSIAPVMSGMRQLVDVVGDIWSMMTVNPYLCVCLGGSLLSLGIVLFKRAKRAAR